MAQGQERASADAVLTRIGQVVILHHAGDREEARRRFLGLWAEIGEHGAPLHRCTLAHYLADTQDDPGDELAWDLRALAAAEELTGGDRPAAPGPPSAPGVLDGQHGPAGGGAVGDQGAPAAPGHRERLAVRALYPALHLNLAADYDRLGRRDAARLHLRRARRAAVLLAGDRYGEGVRAGIDRLARRIGDDGPAAGEPHWGPPRQRP
ncbi:hypothetical protein [Streptomyces sp. SHP 1-2]|uniref:hypothetical protein n=1 Tax=Streptomyces sp. SHP 1-2 TaxID=2769489 RepID=UPI00223722E2|nr:hypothetical protein [Streptomyces sp. SHP 1-2]MCW5253702.1 hypothetical protein [Streptomyces sp. SHP 1-2]